VSNFSCHIPNSKICENCGVKYELSKQDRLLRKMVSVQSRMFPVLKDVVKEAENFCNEGWKAKVKPTAEACAGVKSIE